MWGKYRQIVIIPHWSSYQSLKKQQLLQPKSNYSFDCRWKKMTTWGFFMSPRCLPVQIGGKSHCYFFTPVWVQLPLFQEYWAVLISQSRGPVCLCVVTCVFRRENMQWLAGDQGVAEKSEKTSCEFSHLFHVAHPLLSASAQCRPQNKHFLLPSSSDLADPHLLMAPIPVYFLRCNHMWLYVHMQGIMQTAQLLSCLSTCLICKCMWIW